MSAEPENIAADPDVLWLLSSLVQAKVSVRDVLNGEVLEIGSERTPTRTVDWRSALEGATRAELVTVTDADDPVVALSARGGAIWERVVQPDWSMFVDAHEDNGLRRMVVHGASMKIVDEYLAFLRFGWLIEGEEERAEIANWPATYWKTLSRGYECRVRTCGDTGWMLQADGDLRRRMAYAACKSRRLWWRSLPIV